MKVPCNINEAKSISSKKRIALIGMFKPTGFIKNVTVKNIPQLKKWELLVSPNSNVQPSIMTGDLLAYFIFEYDKKEDLIFIKNQFIEKNIEIIGNFKYDLK